ncbi:MAG: dihydrofolate reductase [Legionellales bacterium]|nr:dihydrofolate reductase [Legionellales bacterium]
MSLLSLIAAVDERGGLGKDNHLLCHLPADLKHFKETTLHKPIIMGRKTFQSIGRALPGRLNIVLSREPFLQLEGATVVDSLAHAMALTVNEPEVVVIGGAGVYEQALPLASRIYLTVIHAEFEADVFFPKIDLTLWHCGETEERPRDELNPFDLTFYRYQK